jgi:hypothetical protein
LVVVIGSFLITLALIEPLIRPFQAMRMLFGMKPRKRKAAGLISTPLCHAI